VEVGREGRKRPGKVPTLDTTTITDLDQWTPPANHLLKRKEEGRGEDLTDEDNGLPY